MKLYICPSCRQSHRAEEWNKKTEEAFQSSNIKPIEEANDAPDYRYVCPKCCQLIDIVDIKMDLISLKPGDICIVKDNDILTGLYRSLIGKHVIILNGPIINRKYPIDVISPDSMFQRSTQLQMRIDLLVKADRLANF